MSDEPKVVHNHYSLLGNLEGCGCAIVIVVFLLLTGADDAIKIIRAIWGHQ